MIKSCSLNLFFILLFIGLTACTDKDDLSSKQNSSENINAANNTQSKRVISELLDQIETEVNAGNFEGFISFFAEDAIIMGEGTPDVVGIENIRDLYASAMEQSTLFVDFNNTEIEVFGNFAYEKGTYLLRVSSKEANVLIAESESRYLHIFKKQDNGEWKTWRMFVNNFQSSN